MVSLNVAFLGGISVDMGKIDGYLNVLLGISLKIK